jgi:hypothetical protein
MQVVLSTNDMRRLAHLNISLRKQSTESWRDMVVCLSSKLQGFMHGVPSMEVSSRQLWTDGNQSLPCAYHQQLVILTIAAWHSVRLDCDECIHFAAQQTDSSQAFPSIAISCTTRAGTSLPARIACLTRLVPRRHTEMLTEHSCTCSRPKD